MHVVKKGYCAQADIPEQFLPYVSKFGFEHGSCPDAGYTVEDGAKEVKIPMLGDITLALYSKPAASHLKFPTASASLYKAELGHLCEELDVPAEFQRYVERFTGFSEGTCASQGYTSEAGEKSINIPILGDLTIKLYDKLSLGGVIPVDA